MRCSFSHLYISDILGLYGVRSTWLSAPAFDDGVALRQSESRENIASHQGLTEPIPNVYTIVGWRKCISKNDDVMGGEYVMFVSFDTQKKHEREKNK